MNELQSLGVATVIGLGVVFSGIGMGCMVGHLMGTNTTKGRGRAMLSGLLFGLFMLNAFVWLAFNGKGVLV